MQNSARRTKKDKKIVIDILSDDDVPMKPKPSNEGSVDIQDFQVSFEPIQPSKQKHLSERVEDSPPQKKIKMSNQNEIEQDQIQEDVISDNDSNESSRIKLREDKIRRKIKILEFGSFERGDKVQKIEPYKVTKDNSAEVFKVLWRKRRDGLQPKPSFVDYQELKHQVPFKVISWWEHLWQQAKHTFDYSKSYLSEGQQQSVSMQTSKIVAESQINQPVQQNPPELVEEIIPPSAAYEDVAPPSQTLMEIEQVLENVEQFQETLNQVVDQTIIQELSRQIEEQQQKLNQAIEVVDTQEDVQVQEVNIVQPSIVVPDIEEEIQFLPPQKKIIEKLFEDNVVVSQPSLQTVHSPNIIDRLIDYTAMDVEENKQLNEKVLETNQLNEKDVLDNNKVAVSPSPEKAQKSPPKDIGSNEKRVSPPAKKIISPQLQTPTKETPQDSQYIDLEVIQQLKQAQRQMKQQQNQSQSKDHNFEKIFDIGSNKSPQLKERITSSTIIDIKGSQTKKPRSILEDIVDIAEKLKGQVSKEQKKIVEVISDDKPNEIEILSSEVSQERGRKGDNQQEQDKHIPSDENIHQRDTFQSAQPQASQQILPSPPMAEEEDDFQIEA